MSVHNRVIWSEGLFLQPQHFQQQERYFERYVETRCRSLVPHAWGFTEIEFDRQLKKGASILSVPAKMKYWDLYRELREEIVKDPETSFRELFGEEFAKAYEEQLRRLKNKNKSKSDAGNT